VAGCGARTPLGDGNGNSDGDSDVRQAPTFTIKHPVVRSDCFPVIGPNDDRLQVIARLLSSDPGATAYTIVRGEIIDRSGAVRYTFAVDPAKWISASDGLELAVIKTRNSVSPKGTCAVRNNLPVRVRLFLRASDGAETSSTSDEITATVTS
jgi:hypothetical protein